MTYSRLICVWRRVASCCAAAVLMVLLPLAYSPFVAAEPVVVKVGGYSFPPFVDETRDSVTHDLIAALNSIQEQYRFEFVRTSSGRRYKDLSEGRFSHIFFESIAWGWDESAVDASRVYLRGDGEVYVALAKPGRSKAMFQELRGHRLLGVTGYHYGFANFEANPAALQKQFRISFADDSEALMRMLIKERGDIAVVTRSYLQSYLREQPELKERLLVSDHFDQAYNHTVLVRKASTPGAREMDKLLDALERSGALQRIWTKHGISN